MKQFGSKLTPELMQFYAQSKHWDGKKFVNLEETTMEFKLANFPELLYKQWFKKEGRVPKQPLPVLPFNKKKFLEPSHQAKFIWYGHSVLLMRINNKTILIDPMLGNNTSPIAPFATKRFSKNTLNLIDDFPELDLILLSHDHYDHLDLDSIEKLIPKTKRFFTALGVGRHLVEWGVNKNQITEFDWWNEHVLDGIRMTFTPSRHFSGRGLNDRAKSLWGGWVLRTEHKKIYFTGDGGYGRHFKEIGENLGPFDVGFVECGQYNKNWHQIHMYPEEGVQGAKDAQIQKIMPVHWAAFALAQHSWTEPIERFVAEAQRQQIPLLTPQLGEGFSMETSNLPFWWK